jgi:hypothetical protein
LSLRAADWADDGGHAFSGQLGISEHGSWIGALIVLEQQFNLLAENAARLVDLFEREARAVDCVHAGFGVGARGFVNQPDLDRVGREHGHRKNGGRNRSRKAADE